MKRWVPVNSDDLIERYKALEPIESLVARSGVAQRTLFRFLKEQGVSRRRRPRPWMRKTLPLSDRAIARAHGRGLSVRALAQRLGVADITIHRAIVRGGGKPRDYRDATRRLMAATVERWIGAKRRAAHVVERHLGGARARERTRRSVGVVEQAFADFLSEQRIRFTPERAVEQYNLDFAIGQHVAVEITRARTGGHEAATWSRRVEYLLRRGWNVTYVVTKRRGRPTFDRAVAEHLRSLAQQARRDKTSRGQYWMIRSNGDLVASGRLEDDHLTIVPAAGDGAGGDWQ